MHSEVKTLTRQQPTPEVLKAAHLARGTIGEDLIDVIPGVATKLKE
jgi:hypothetical protein